MKASPFSCHAPDTVDEAVGTLAALSEEAKVLASGQSLVLRDTYATETAWAPRMSGRSCGCPGSAPSTPL
jgi:hypothetical protein